jgi:hypothetical protein
MGPQCERHLSSKSNVLASTLKTSSWKPTACRLSIRNRRFAAGETQVGLSIAEVDEEPRSLLVIMPTESLLNLEAS